MTAKNIRKQRENLIKKEKLRRFDKENFNYIKLFHNSINFIH